MSTYEPGTVAVATVNGEENVRVFRTGCPSNMGWEYNRPDGQGHGWSSDRSDRVTDVRPVIVLDPTTSPEPLNSTFAATFLDAAAEIVESTTKRKVREVPFLRWLADQIEEQTKPPRIPEPGLWGVVEVNIPGGRSSHGWVVRRLTGGEADWQDGAGDYYRWDELKDPVLVRDGIEAHS